MKFTDALMEAKRRAMLTGRPLTSQETRGIQNGWFDSAANMSSRNRALKLEEDRLAEAKLLNEQQLSAAEKAQRNQMLSNVGNNLVSGIGTDYIKNGDNSMLAKGIGAGQELLGIGNQTPATFTEALKPALSEATGTGTGLSIAPELGTLQPASELAASEAGATASGIAEGGSLEAMAEATPATGITASTVAGKAMPYVAAAQIGGYLGQKLGENVHLSDENFGMQFADTLQHPFEISRWAEIGNGDKELTGGWKTVKDVLDPVGWLSDSMCIIVTACTSKNSPEVEIARQYRDKFLDAGQLRGYYALAEKVVPALERNNKARKAVKKYLVDRLIDYGEYRLGLKTKRPMLSSFIISKAFLGVIKLIGFVLPQYIRKNGEVY
ncbi:MAG: hypothetical protein ABFD76_15410 [Smithella sp.]